MTFPRLFLSSILLAAAVIPTAFADVSVTPTTISKTMRESPSHDGSAPQTYTPARVQIALTLTPSETWTVTKGGALTTSCFFSSSCFGVEDTSGNNILDGTGGTGNATIVLRWGTGNQGNLTPGAYTGTITVNPATGSDVVVNITLTVVAYASYLAVTYNSSYPLTGCTNPQAIFYNYLPTCSIPDSYPPDTDFSIPAIGGSYVDARFGSTVTRLTSPAVSPCAHAYSTRSPLSINNTYLLCANYSGFLQVYRISDQTLVYANVPAGNISATFWSPIAGEDEVLYWLDGVGTIKKRVLNTSTTTTVKDMTGSPWNFTAITDGGTSKPSRNGYLTFWDAPTTTVCALHIATATPYCANYSGIATFSHIDFVEVEYDSVSLKTYVKFIAAPKSPQWEVNTGGGVLTLIGSFDESPETSSAAVDGDGICETGESCLGEPHSTLVVDQQGKVHMFWAGYVPTGDDSFFSTAELAAGAGMLRPVEESGGGFRFLQTFGANGDSHFGGSAVGAMVVSSYTPNIPAKVISAATSANPAVLTVTSHGYSNGQVKVVGSAAGNTCINGIWTIANVTANTFELASSTCSGAGAYSSNTGRVATGVAETTTANIGVVFLAVPGTSGYIKPLAQHRSIAYEDGVSGLMSCCNTNPRAAISMDGSRIIFMSNMGVPEVGSIYMIQTGFAVAAPTSIRVGGGMRVGGGVVVQ